MPQSLSVIIVEKSGELKLLNIKDYKEEELYKKCGFKKVDGFVKHVDWPIKIDGTRYVVSVYGKLYGKVNMENKYDFPPPIDTKLFFGACLLVGYKKETEKGEKTLSNLSLSLWNKMYEKLFGGFENLNLTVVEDEEEEDELAAIPASKKTKKGGYLKDGFVVDSDQEDPDLYEDESDDDSDEFNDSIETSDPDAKGDAIVFGEIGSELSEEEYDYASDS